MQVRQGCVQCSTKTRKRSFRRAFVLLALRAARFSHARVDARALTRVSSAHSYAL